jgi:hypothetical protein
MNQAERRRQVLLAWAYVQRQQGELIPTNDELSHIAMVRAVPPGLRTPVVNRWAHVLHHLMWLSDQGHPDPVTDARRMAPAGPPLASPGPILPVPQRPQPQPTASDQSLGARLSSQAKQVMDSLNREIEAATESARQAAAQGREAGPHLIRRNTLRDRLAQMNRGERVTPPSSAAEAPGPPEETVQVPTGRAAEAVPPPVRHDPAEPAPPAVQPSGPASQQSAPVDDTLDPVQRLMVWRDRGGHQELKDRHIRQIVNSGARDAAEVAAGLPVSLKPLAPAIAGELGLNESPLVPEQSPLLHAAEPTPRQHAGASDEGVNSDPAMLNPKALSWQQPARLAEELVRFAEMDFSQPTGDPGAIRVSTRGDHLTLRWSAVDDPAGVTLYRVVSDDDHVPYSPNASEVIGITAETTYTDARPFHSAVRHYQVWVNRGSSMAEAMLEQPTLHAGVPVVAKPGGVDIREDEGRVVGHWMLFGEARRVQIFRVPAERAGVVGNPAYRICADEDNLNGFVDDGAEPGRRYLYQLLVEAEVEGNAQLSLPTVVPVTTSARLVAVPDLVCERHERDGSPRFDLEWTAPHQGRVVIYRTAAPPLAGADADTVDESALPRMNLRPETRLNYPSDIVEGRASVRDVPWPRDWHRTYFTPVTLFGGQARVGRTASAVHVGAPGDPRVVERVSEQVLTMEWPDGADTVKVYAAARRGSADEAIATGSAVAEISREKYERLGGLHFPTPLDPHGCSLHLLPMAFSRGEAVHGRPVSLDYPGLLRMHYTLEVRRGARGRGPVLLWIRVQSDRPNPTAPPFVIVHHPHRLPLDVGDGQVLLVQPNTGPPGQPMHRFYPQLTPAWSEPGWITDVTGRAGWVRVFIDHQSRPGQGTVALLDPPVTQLYLGGGQ